MEPDFWHRRWYKNEIAFHQERINLHLQSVWPALASTPPATVFVPLCGKSKDMLWLAEQGFDVIGIELSAIAVEDFFKENHLAPTVTTESTFKRYQSGRLTLLQGDFFELLTADLGGKVTVYDRASLIAFPPEMRPRYSKHLCALLTTGTQMLLISMEYPEHEIKGPPFSVPESEVRRLFEDEMHIEKLREMDVLAENPRFIQRGLTSLQEKVFKLVKR